MLKNRYMKYFIVFILFISVTGCNALQRKFVRKKKKEKIVAPVITTKDYSKGLRADELYKKHFVYWKVWQTELMERMDDSTYKKRKDCYKQTIESLDEMERYLTGVKKEELMMISAEVKAIEPQINKRRLSKSEVYKIKRTLEAIKRKIDKNFSYSDVKDFLAMEE